MTTQTGPPSMVTTNQVTTITLPHSARPGPSFLEFHYSHKIDVVDAATLVAIRTPDGRWYRDANRFAPPTLQAIKIGVTESLSVTEGHEAIDATEALLRNRTPISSALVERTSVFLEPDSTISITATVRNTTGQWLFGYGSSDNSYDALGVRFVTLRGTIIAEHRVHFPFQMIPPGGSAQLRGSLLWSDLSLPPGTFQVSLDVVREGINWSRPLMDTPQHTIVIPKSIYETSPEIARFSTTKRLITFTFNAHADELYTNELLDVLETMGVVATFFVTGHFIRRYPSLIRRMVAGQHEIGNLTDTYPQLTYPGGNLPIPSITHERLQNELRQTEAVFTQITGLEIAKIWRAPHGCRNAPLLQWATDIGYRHIMWSLDSHDSRVDPERAGGVTMQAVAARVEQFLEQPLCRGGIILFNASSNHLQQPLYDTVQRLIELAWSRGFSFRTIGEMIDETAQPPSTEKKT